MTGDSLRIRCAQLAPVIGAVKENIRRVEQEIARASQDGIDLLVLPELATSGYALTPEEARAAAMPADSPVLGRWVRLAGDGLTAVIGFCEDGSDDGDGIVYNSAAVLIPGAPAAVYRKVHLWDTEKLVFAPGDAEPPVLAAPFGLLGVLICYDLEFPEMPRSLALRGADAIAVPTNWPLLERPEREHAPEVVQAMAAARASGVAIACCDRAGDERGIRWTEGSCVVGPEGWPIGSADDAGRVDGEIRLRADRRRISARNDLLGDRRPHAYGPLAAKEGA